VNRHVRWIGGADLRVDPKNIMVLVGKHGRRRAVMGWGGAWLTRRILLQCLFPVEDGPYCAMKPGKFKTFHSVVLSISAQANSAFGLW